MFQVIGTPADSIRESLSVMPLRLLPLSKAAVSKLTADHAGYFEHTIAKGTYAAQNEDVYTVGTAALLLTDTAFSGAEIAALTRSIFAPGHDYSSLGSAQAAQISLATSRVGVSVPMHSNAAQTLEAMEKEAAEGVQSQDVKASAKPNSPPDAGALVGAGSDTGELATKNEAAAQETGTPSQGQ